MAALSDSAKYYRDHPEAAKKKQRYDAVLNRRPDQVRKRVALNKYNREHNAKKGDGMDASHKYDRIVGYIKASKNRGDKDNSAGDRNARGGRGR